MAGADAKCSFVTSIFSTHGTQGCAATDFRNLTGLPFCVAFIFADRIAKFCLVCSFVRI